MKNLDIADIAWKLMGPQIEYDWGGNYPTTGLDCSGFVCEVLRSYGAIGPEDLTSQMLYNRFYVNEIRGPARNCLLFFGKSKKFITHVAIAISGTHIIEAAGEGRESTRRGYVRLRPITYRGDLVACTVIH